MQRKMPMGNRTERKPMIKITDKLVFVNPLEAAKAALPLFGGEDKNETPGSSSTTTEEKPGSVDSGSAGGSGSDTPSGGEPGPTTDDLSKNPEAIADLLKQLSDAGKTIKQLQKTNTDYETQKKSAERAQQTREQQLEGDLQEAQQTIARMDSVIRHTAAINAIQNMKDYKFHSARHVLNELDSNEYDITVDLEHGTATVDGIENAVKRIAKDMPWLVAQQGDGQAGSRPGGRPTGAPPSAPNGDAGKAARRDELMRKFPVISHGRAR